MPKTKTRMQTPEDKHELARLMLVFHKQNQARQRQVRRLVVLGSGSAPMGPCVGPDLRGLARLYPNLEAVIGVGVDKEALLERWPKAHVSRADVPPPPATGDRWVFYDPAALDGQGGWRLMRPA